MLLPDGRDLGSLPEVYCPMKKPREFPVPHGQMVWTKDFMNPKPVYATAMTFSGTGGADRYRWYMTSDGYKHLGPSVFESATQKECLLKILLREEERLSDTWKNGQVWLEEKKSDLAIVAARVEKFRMELGSTRLRIKRLQKLKSGR